MPYMLGTVDDLVLVNLFHWIDGTLYNSRRCHPIDIVI